MFSILIALALILVLLYGIVSFIQQRRQFGRGLEIVMQKRNQIAGGISHLSTDAEFLNVYREGEIGETAKALSERMNTLMGVFRETVDECDKLTKGRYHRLDMQVHLARVEESLEKINQEVQRLNKSFQAFHEQIEKSRDLVKPLQQRLENVKNRISDILHNKIPSEWVQEWKELERGLTSLSLRESEGSVADPFTFFSKKVELWMERAEALSVWSEWTHGFKERIGTLVSCRDKILTAGVENTCVCRLIDELVDTVSETVALSPEQLIKSQGIERTGWIQHQLPAVLSFAMQILSVLNHPETVTTVIRRCVYDANTLMETVQSSTFINEEQIVINAKNQLMEPRMEDKQKWVESLKTTADQVKALNTISVREAIPYLDVLLSTCVNLQQYVQKVEQFYLVLTSGSKIVHERVEAILSRLAHAMAELAEVGLLNSGEYRKLSKWQEELNQVAESAEPDVSVVEQYEKRIANELVIVGGLAKGHKRIDSSMQGHLEKLAHSGRYRGAYRQDGISSGFPSNVPSSGPSDILSAAFGALVIGEILADERWDNNFDIW